MWDYIVAVIFGIVEGVTEWIPISSTGHMILLNEFLKLNVSPEFFDLYLVVIQLGAILAAVVLFWKDIWPFGRKDNEDPFSDSGIGRYVKKDKIVLWIKIVIACIPAGIVGVLFEGVFEKYFYNPISVAMALIVFGIAFLLVEHLIKDKDFKVRSLERLTYKNALVIGIWQVIAAVFPGTSRSGTTIIGSLLMGISREIAARFTFVLAIPVMFGASLLKIIKYKGTVTANEAVILAIGVIVAFGVSFVVIKWMLAFIRKHDFKPFGIYRIVLGLIVLIYGIFFAK